MQNCSYSRQRQVGDTREISSKSSALKKLESSYASQKIEQQKDLAQLQMDKMEGDSTQENVTAPYEGTVCYLYSCKTGDTIPAGTVVAVIARDNSKKLFGEYIEKSVLADADRVYAVINEKEYTGSQMFRMTSSSLRAEHSGICRYIQLFILKMMTK